MKKVLLIHGFVGNPDKVWFPWIRWELQKKGYEVFTPQMPRTGHPQLEEWLTALDPYMEKLEKDDIIIGHSLGGKTALHLLLRHEKKIGRLILVAPAISKRSEEDWERKQQNCRGFDIPALRRYWEEKIEYYGISRYAKVTVLFSDDDYAVPPFTEGLPESWLIKIWHGFGHFCQYCFPELLSEVLSYA